MSGLAERILAAARGAAPYARQVGVFSVPGLLTGVGVGLAPKAMGYALSNKSIYDLFKQLKEWGPAVFGVALSIIWELAKDRLNLDPRLSQYLGYLVDGVAGAFIGLSIGTLVGEPFAFINDGKLYVKNIDPVNGNYHVIIDGNECSADADGNITCNTSIAEGAHDVAVAGTKAFYLRQYTPAISATSQTA